MARIGLTGYIERKTVGRSGANDVRENWRNWWLIKGKGVKLGTISLPQKYLGKRIRFKIEVIGE